MYNRLYFLVILCFTSVSWAEPTVYVEESVDEIIVLHCKDWRDEVKPSSIIFIKDGKVLAHRWFLRQHSEWAIWTIGPKGFRLVFEDYGRIQRVIDFKSYTVMKMEKDPFNIPAGPWWNQGRNMRNLKQP